jgi:hypothetical protein
MSQLDLQRIGRDAMHRAFVPHSNFVSRLVQLRDLRLGVLRAVRRDAARLYDGAGKNSLFPNLMDSE